jgi:hypothetical protein
MIPNNETHNITLFIFELAIAVLPLLPGIAVCVIRPAGEIFLMFSYCVYG